MYVDVGLLLLSCICSLYIHPRFHETFKHFHDIAEDQFDFHNYCLRKTTLKAEGAAFTGEAVAKHPDVFSNLNTGQAYVAMLRMQERPLSLHSGIAQPACILMQRMPAISSPNTLHHHGGLDRLYSHKFYRRAAKDVRRVSLCLSPPLSLSLSLSLSSLQRVCACALLYGEHDMTAM